MRLIDADVLLKEMNDGKTKYTCRIDINQKASKKDVIYITLKAYRGLVFDIIKDLPIIEMPQWIPCSERLPEDMKDGLIECYLVTDGFLQWMAYYNSKIGWVFAECTNANKIIDWTEIIAWQSLPQPYKGEQL